MPKDTVSIGNRGNWSKISSVFNSSDVTNKFLKDHATDLLGGDDPKKLLDVVHKLDTTEIANLNKKAQILKKSQSEIAKLEIDHQIKIAKMDSERYKILRDLIVEQKKFELEKQEFDKEHEAAAIKRQNELDQIEEQKRRDQILFDEKHHDWKLAELNLEEQKRRDQVLFDEKHHDWKFAELKEQNRIEKEHRDNMAEIEKSSYKYKLQQQERLNKLEEAQKKLESVKSNVKAPYENKKIEKQTQGAETYTNAYESVTSSLSGLTEKLPSALQGLGSIFTDGVGSMAGAMAALPGALGGMLLEIGGKLLSDLTKSIDNTIDRYVEKQEKNTYALTGTGRQLNEIADNLNNTFAASRLVKQEAVYTNVSNLLQAGIVYNVEQRAFLQTIANDMGAIFNPQMGSFPRLIRLQQKDTSSNRLALEYSLKEFLNSSYENSEYIKDQFQTVSDALVEAQSLMSSQSGVELESVVQKWIGSMSSVGLSEGSINQLAKAIGDLGSGNINALSGSGMGNLVIMGASQAGLSYADLLTRGLTASDTDNLMRGIVQYIASMGDNTSNVVKSEYARIFGLQVSDIVAAKNLGEAKSLTQNLNTNINTLLSTYGKMVPLQTQFSNILENFMYTLGTNVAANTSDYLGYKGARLVDQFAEVISSSGGFLGNLIGGGLKLASGVGTIVSLLKPAARTLGDLIESWKIDAGSGVDSLVNQFNNLGSGVEDLKEKITATGAGLDNRYTGESTSSSIQYDAQQGSFDESGVKTSVASDTTDILKSVRTSGMNVDAEVIDADETYVDQQELYKSIKSYINDSAIPFFDRQAFNTYTRISEAANTVTIGANETTTYIKDMLTITAINSENIYSLLLNWFTMGQSGRAGTSLFEDEENTLTQTYKDVFGYGVPEDAGSTGQ